MLKKGFTYFIMASQGIGGEMREYYFKIIIVGDVGTGKTSIIKRYVHNIFSMNCMSTIGVDFALKSLAMEDGQMVVRLQLWDIAGQDRFGPPPSRAPGPGF